MCVAVVVESSPPTDDELEAMNESNPHGAGVAWCAGGRIEYRKGLTVAEIAHLAPSLPTPWLLHFRWATHGSKRPYLSHPFPLGKKALASRALSGSAEAVLIHNGTWSDYGKHVPKKWRRADVSDTAVAAYVAGERGEAILDEVHWATAVMRAAGGGRVDVTIRGDWEKHNGNLYSNLNWQWEGAYSRSYGFLGGWNSSSAGSTTPEHECVVCGDKYYYVHNCKVDKITRFSEAWNRDQRELETNRRGLQDTRPRPQSGETVADYLQRTRPVAGSSAGLLAPAVEDSDSGVSFDEPCPGCGGRYGHYWSCAYGPHSKGWTGSD